MALASAKLNGELGYSLVGKRAESQGFAEVLYEYAKPVLPSRSFLRVFDWNRILECLGLLLSLKEVLPGPSLPIAKSLFLFGGCGTIPLPVRKAPCEHYSGSESVLHSAGYSCRLVSATDASQKSGSL